MSQPQSIYIHLPFCMTKCPYCDFASFAVGDKDRSFDDYIDALVYEIDYRCQGTDKSIIKTIFFGGGTPSVHSQKELRRILDKIQDHFIFDPEIEISLEANPGTVNRDKLQAFKELGINRISFGAQTFDPALLTKLGRGHSINDTYRTLEDIIALDFKSWSFDLIYGLPGQDLGSWQATVDESLSFNPPHISAYALSVEENTPYGDIYKNSKHPDLPQEDDLVAMYQLADESFASRSLKRYEISNWSRVGHEAKHNLCYWRAQEYYAFGLSAHGYLNSKRYANTRDLNRYIEAAKQKMNNFEEQEASYISEADSLEEEILLRLRLEEGLDLDLAAAKKINSTKLDLMLEQGMLEQDDRIIRLTSKGILVSNSVIGELIVN